MRDSRRILHVTTYVHPDRFGGAERVVHGIASAQSSAGHEVVVLSGNHDGRASQELLDGFRLLRFPVPAGASGIRFFLAVSRGVRAALRDLRTRPFDILHTHQVASASPALRARPVAKARIHSFYAPYNEEFAVERGAGQARGMRLRDRLKQQAQSLLDRRCLRLADRVVVLSRFSASQVEQLAPRSLGRVMEIPPGVDTTRFSTGDRCAARQRFGWHPGEFQLVTVRRLVRRMGLDRAIRAVGRVRREVPEVALAIAGEGPERGRLEALVESQNLQDSVRFLGRVDDRELPHLYRSADLFLLPTRALEGFGMVTLEALSCGTPVLGTNVGATVEVLGRYTPDIAPIGPEESDLADGIRLALSRRDEWSSAARRAAERIGREASWQVVASRLDRLYDQALGPEGR